MAAAPTLDEAKIGAPLVVICDRLGLYQAMARSGTITPGELAERTRISERFAREWLNAQATGGYVDYHAGDGTYTLPPEHPYVVGTTMRLTGRQTAPAPGDA
jgi:DNA-binding FadR family transcriptional regulator